MFCRFAAVALIGSFLAFPVWSSSSMNGASSSSAERLSRTQPTIDADYVAGEAAVKRSAWPEAITYLEKVVERDQKNANAWNLLGFAQRNLGEMEKSFASYERALALDPQHKDAHEYVGEAYLQVGNLAKAEEHLRALDNICWLPCEQYTELKEKIEAFKRRASGALVELSGAGR